MMSYEGQYSVVPQFQGQFRLIPYESQGNQIFSDIIFLWCFHIFFLTARFEWTESLKIKK